MAIKVENIIYNIKTTVNELADALTDNSKKVSSLETDVKKSEKTTTAAFDKMGQSAKAYGEKLNTAQREQRRLTDTIREQEKITNEFRSELVRIEQRLRGIGKNSVEFQKLTKEADRLKLAIKDNNVALQNLRLDRNVVNQNVRELQRLQAEATKTAQAAKSAGGGISEFGGALGQLNPQIGGATSQFSSLIGSISKIGPLGAAAAVGIGAIAGGFALAKSRVQEFDEEVQVVLNNVTLGFNRAGDSIALAFASLFEQDKTATEKAQKFGGGLGLGIIQGANTVFGKDFATFVSEAFFGKGAGKAFAEVTLATEEAAKKTREELTKAEQAFARAEINNIVRKAQLESEIAAARADFEESRTEGIKNQDAFNRLVKAENELITLGKNEIKEKIRITEELNKLTLSRFDKEGRIVAELKAQEIALDVQADQQRRAQQRLLRFLKSGTDAQVGEINRLEAEIKKLEDAIKSALNEEDRQRYNTKLIATRAELQNILDSLEAKPKLGIFEQVEAELQRLQGLLKKAGSEEEAIAIIARIVGEEEVQKDLNNILNEVKRRFADPEGFQAEISPLDLLGTLQPGGSLLTEQNKKAIERQQKAVADEFKKRELEIIGKQQIEDEAKKALQVYAELSRDILRQDIERTDRQIELQRERVSEFQRIAENGNAEQLQLEEERLKELLEKRERYAQRERAISALLVAAANAEAIASGISAVAKGFTGPGAPFTGIANAIALAATIGSTIVALRNATSSIPAFAEGTEYVNRNGAPKGKDTIFARLNEGERVLTTEQNAKLKGISNSKLVEIASEYKLNNMRMKNIWSAGKREDNSDLIRGINRTNKLLEGLNLYADVNEYGLQMGISRAERNMNRRRNLAR